jgi:spore coat protein U-like protein
MILHHRARLRARLLLGAAAVLGLSLGTQSAIAQDGQIQVFALVQADCSVVAGNAALDFDTYDSSDSGPTLANTTFSVTCTSATDVTVSLDEGSNADGTTRRMSSNGGGGPLLTYELWQDPARQIKFGDDSGLGTSKSIPVEVGPGTEVPVFGSIVPGQQVPAGSYQDVVNIILTVT